MAGERRQEILQMAIRIIADDGYGSLTMRALARASGMKLGALQYHFRTWEDLLRSVVGYIAQEIQRDFEAKGLHLGSASVAEIAAFMLDETAGSGDVLLSDHLWPQLWAMEHIEPLVSELLEEIYAKYLDILVEAMTRAGIESARGEALCLMSLLEGESLFTGEGRRWEGDRALVRQTILQFIEEKYGDSQ